MASRKSQYASLTFLLYLALLAFASIADASSHIHSNHKRMLKKRLPQLLPTPDSNTRTAISSLPDPSSSPSSPSTPTATVSSPPVVTGNNSTSSSSSVSSSSSSSSSSSRSSSSSSASTQTFTNTVTSASSSSTSSSSSSSSSSTTSGPSTIITTETAGGASSTPSVPPSSSNNNGPDTKKTTTMVIIIIAASVGGVTILWTLFRKWKLGRSSRFDNRLQPIDWQPPSEGQGRQRRPTSMDTFPGATHSAHASSEHGHTSASDHGGRLTPIPDHDFTVLPANPFAAIGTYADLARGASPKPQMQETSYYNPMLTRPAYDVNVPLHHQAGYGGQDAYDYTHYNSAPMRH